MNQDLTYTLADCHESCTYFFCWELERREHSKAPTTNAMMMKPPTDTMMTITRMWFSLPGIPDFP